MTGNNDNGRESDGKDGLVTFEEGRVAENNQSSQLPSISNQMNVLSVELGSY